jgi:hypothetical protein
MITALPAPRGGKSSFFTSIKNHSPKIKLTESQFFSLDDIRAQKSPILIDDFLLGG